MLEKKCSECKIIKNINEFYINRSCKDGYQYRCKGCANIYDKKYREKNKKEINKYKKKYREENKDYFKEWRKENSDKIKEHKKNYNDQRRNRRSNDPLYKLSDNMRTTICNSLKKGGYTKNSKSADILGCSYPELLDHLNDNKYGFVYGDNNLDIDHIVPLSRATTKEEIIKLNHYTNLQLLPADYNRHIKRDNDFDKDCLEKWLEKNKNN